MHNKYICDELSMLKIFVTWAAYSLPRSWGHFLHNLAAATLLPPRESSTMAIRWPEFWSCRQSPSRDILPTEVEEPNPHIFVGMIRNKYILHARNGLIEKKCTMQLFSELLFDHLNLTNVVSWETFIYLMVDPRLDRRAEQNLSSMSHRAQIPISVIIRIKITKKVSKFGTRDSA